MPEGWMVSRADGQPLTDPAAAGEGMLLPIGGHKGSGLAIVLGLLAGPLSGAVFGRDVVDFNADSSTETNTGHFIMALDIARFVEPQAFHDEVSRHLADLRDSERLPEAEPIRMPGDQRAARRAERERNGVPIPAPLLEKLNEVAETLSIEPLRLRSASVKPLRERVTLERQGVRGENMAKSEQGHHHLRGDRRDPHAVDVAAICRSRRTRSPSRRWRRPRPARRSCIFTPAIPRPASPTRRRRRSRASCRASSRRPNAAINITTGGSPYMRVEERVKPAEKFKPEVASLNMGSINFALFTGCSTATRNSSSTGSSRRWKARATSSSATASRTSSTS